MDIRKHMGNNVKLKHQELQQLTGNKRDIFCVMAVKQSCKMQIYCFYFITTDMTMK